jgi:superfamily II DNA or RNA helicase
MPDWKEFEYFVCDKHRKDYGQTVWHVDSIPEIELEASGFINDYNAHRLKRIANRREAEGKSIKFNDYGMDFLALDKDNNYHPGQAKCYTDKKVTANDIGSFLAVTLGFKQKGYLYTTTDMEPNCRDFLLASDMIDHHKVLYNNSFMIPTMYPREIDYDLYPYQKEAVQQLLDITLQEHNRKCLQLFCGGGKTVIAGNVLKQSNYQLILCIAPLRISVEQLKIRLHPFLPDHTTLLVDSDTGGTTDSEYIKSYIQKHEKLIIFSTYKSTQDVLLDIIDDFGKNTYLLVDEVHNMINNEKLCEFANKFHNGLFLSATIPEEAHEVLDMTVGYSYSITDAIQNKYICDYNIWFPYIDITDDTVPIEFKGMDKNLTAKAMFLATGMLQTGSRRCIVYLPNQSDCDAFLRVAKVAFEIYHGIEFWGEKIDSTVCSKKRADILKEFQATVTNVIKIITSVRVLDEAIDIPKCDSEFITHIGEATSDIRTVQRICRGCRLDKDNVNKVNNVFLWCDEWDKVVNCLQLLKDNDPMFHKKLKVTGINYDRIGKKESKKKVADELQNLVKYVDVKCLSSMEKFEIRRQQWIEQCKKLGDKAPSKHSKDATVKSLGYWQQRMRMLYHGTCNDGSKPLSQQKIQILNTTPGWYWSNDDLFERNLALWKKHYSEFSCKGKGSSKDIEKQQVESWQNRVRRTYRGTCNDGSKPLTQQQIQILNTTPGWYWSNADKFADKFEKYLALWKEHYSKYQRKPVQSSKNAEEKRVANWQNRVRQTYRGNSGCKPLTQEQIQTLSQTTGWTWS